MTRKKGGRYDWWSLLLLSACLIITGKSVVVWNDESRGQVTSGIKKSWIKKLVFNIRLHASPLFHWSEHGYAFVTIEVLFPVNEHLICLLSAKNDEMTIMMMICIQRWQCEKRNAYVDRYVCRSNGDISPSLILPNKQDYVPFLYRVSAWRLPPQETTLG